MEIIGGFIAVGCSCTWPIDASSVRSSRRKSAATARRGIYIAWHRRIWLHDDGIQYKPYRHIESIEHPALPRRSHEAS
jgi:hypothetical protein